MATVLLLFGLFAFIVGIGVMLSSALPRHRQQWKRRTLRGMWTTGGGLVALVVGGVLSPSPVPPTTAVTQHPSPVAATPSTAAQPPSSAVTASPAPVEAPPSSAATTLLSYVAGQHDQQGFQSNEVLSDGLRSYSWDTIPNVAGSLFLNVLPGERTNVFMAQLGDVNASDEAFLGQAPRLMAETTLNRRFCVMDGALKGMLVDVTALTDGSKQVQVYSEAYRRLRHLTPEIRCGTDA